MLIAVEQLHSKGILHRDIKPANFRIDGEKVGMIDFYLAKSYLAGENKHEHIKETDQNFIGTLHFSSISTHNNRNQSRRDDLECLGYSLLFLYTRGKGFWMEDICNDGNNISKKTHELFMKKKRDFLCLPLFPN